MAYLLSPFGDGRYFRRINLLR